MTLMEPLKVTGIVVDVLEDMAIPYMVGGSLASSLHGIPRSTQDADIVLDIRMEHVIPLSNALGSSFYVDAEMIGDAISRQASFNVIHLATMFKVDMFVVKNDPFSINEMKRREKYQVIEESSRAFFMASAEDTVLRKLEWFRLGGEVSERQWEDVKGVLEIQKDKIDKTYLNKGAHQLGVADLLEKMVKEVES